MENEIPKDLPSNVLMQLDNDALESINLEEGTLPEEIELMLKQTAMRTILHQVSENYREELEKLLGAENIDESGQPKALSESTIPFELYEFICKNVIGTVPSIEIEITNEESDITDSEEDSVSDI